MRVGLIVVACAVMLTGCGPRRVNAPGAADPSLVVLIADPDTGEVGRVTVTNAAGAAVDLATDRASTRVTARRAPSQARPIDDQTFTRFFASTLANLPVAPQTFTLYFRLDSNELTDESRVMLPGVLKAASTHPAPDVAIVGHTDTSGDAKANVTLGLDRATAVRALLTDVGVDPAVIEISSHGESDLLVPTPDDTYEPRNRRVEISVR